MHACSAADCAARQSTAMAHILLLEPRFSFTCGASGDLVLDLNPPDGLSRFSQVLMYLDQPAEDIYLDPPPLSANTNTEHPHKQDFVSTCRSCLSPHRHLQTHYLHCTRNI